VITAIVRRRDGDVNALAREAGLHPALVGQLIRLGAIDEVQAGEAAARLARCVRLRQDLGLNYAGAILACQLLARIDELEARVRRYER
jgi:hypothetical protein